MQYNLYFKMVIIFDDVDNDRLRMKTQQSTVLISHDFNVRNKF